MRRRRQRPSWTALVRELGLSIIDLLHAETRALKADLAHSGKQAGIGLGLIATAAALLFWSLGVATLVLVALLALVLPLWGAAASVLGILVATAAILGWLGARGLRSIEPPGVTVSRHVEDLRDWWANDLRLDSGDAVVTEEEGEDG